MSKNKEEVAAAVPFKMPIDAVATMHLVNAVTLPGFVGGQTTFSKEKTPEITMTDIVNGVLLVAESPKRGLKSTAFIPMSNIKILVYA